MNGVWWTWFAGWFTILLWQGIVYPARTDKGYIGRTIVRIVCWMAGPRSFSLRWLLTDVIVFVSVMFALFIPISLGLEAAGAHFDGEGFLPMIVKVFDDILNGEDDGWKKRWQAAKNKVKWLWTPAMEPARDGS